MNTDFNFDFTTSGDENDHLDYLLNALIRKYNRYSLHEWKVGLYYAEGTSSTIV